MRFKLKVQIALVCVALILASGIIYYSYFYPKGKVSEVASKWLHTEGRYIKDSSGNIVYLRGVSKMGLEYTRNGFHIVESDYDLMKEMGVNVVRIPYTMEWIYNSDYLSKIDRQIQWCKERNIYVILDMHRPNHRGQQSFPWNETAWISQWLFLAERYKEEPTVIGFDLFNEPHDVGWIKWKNAAEKAAKAIHEVNPNLLIFVQGIGWGWDLAGAHTNPINETNIVYSPHIYPYPLSHTEWSYAYKEGNYEHGYQLLRDYIKSNWEPILTNNIAPILVGEFGTPAFEEHNLRWMKDLLEIMHKLEASYTCWVFYGSDKPRDCALLKPDWKTYQPQTEILIEYLKRDKLKISEKAPTFFKTLEGFSSSFILNESTIQPEKERSLFESHLYLES